MKPRASLVVALIPATAAVLAWPGVFERFASTGFFVGNVRDELRVVSVVLALVAFAVLAVRRRIDAVGRQVGFALVTLGLAGLLTCVLVEGILRLTGLPFPEDWVPGETAIGRFDPQTGWSYRPRFSKIETFGDDTRVPLHFDRLGNRAASPDAVPDPAAPTLLFVGGSVTMGHGVSFEDSYPARVGRLAGPDYQIVNAGVQGFGTDQAFVMMRRQLEAFDDVRAVVYGFICDHVLRNSVADRRSIYRHARFLGTKPRFGVDLRGRLVQTDVPVRTEELRYSHLAAYLRVLRWDYGPLPRTGVTRAIVAEMDALARAHGARFLLVQWPPEGWVTEAVCGASPFADLGVAVLDLDARLPAGWTEWNIPGDGHPAPTVHELVAGEVVEELRRLGLD